MFFLFWNRFWPREASQTAPKNTSCIINIQLLSSSFVYCQIMQITLKRFIMLLYYNNYIIIIIIKKTLGYYKKSSITNTLLFTMRYLSSQKWRISLPATSPPPSFFKIVNFYWACVMWLPAANKIQSEARVKRRLVVEGAFSISGLAVFEQKELSSNFTWSTCSRMLRIGSKGNLDGEYQCKISLLDDTELTCDFKVCTKSAPCSLIDLFNLLYV